MLDTLVGKKYFSFLNGFNGYNQIKISLEDQEETTFTWPWGTFSYRALPFSLCNAHAIFQIEVLRIFLDLIHACVEVFMDDFSVYGDTFNKAMNNLEKVLIKFQETNLALSHEKCRMLFTKGVVLGHIISQDGVEIDPTKLEVIINLPIPKTPKEVRIFLGHVGYYRQFIENSTNIATPLFKLLTKDVEFKWDDHC